MQLVSSKRICLSKGRTNCSFEKTFNLVIDEVNYENSGYYTCTPRNGSSVLVPVEVIGRQYIYSAVTMWSSESTQSKTFVKTHVRSEIWILLWILSWLHIPYSSIKVFQLILIIVFSIHSHWQWPLFAMIIGKIHKMAFSMLPGKRWSCTGQKRKSICRRLLNTDSSIYFLSWNHFRVLQTIANLWTCHVRIVIVFWRPHSSNTQFENIITYLEFKWGSVYFTVFVSG